MMKAEQTRSPELASPAWSRATPPGAVLLLNVDDSDAARYTKSHWLRAAGYEVIEASTGAAALRLVAERRPALVVLDVKLPDIDGFEVCRRIKSDAATAAIAVLQVSATFLNEDARVRGLEHGADHYLTMPTEPQVLLASVRALLRLRAAEEQARRSGERARSVLASITDIYFALDRAWRFVELNPKAEQLFRRAADELLGKVLWTEFPQVAAGELSDAYRRAAAENVPVHFERRSLLDERWYEAHIYPRDGGVEVYLRDVHDRRMAEEALKAAKLAAEQASQAKDRFLAVLSHELRTPLTPVLGAAAMLARTPSLDPELREVIEIIRRNVELEARLIDDLLDLSRIVHGKFGLDRSPVDVCQAVDVAVEVCRPEAEERGLRLERQRAGCPLPVHGDAARLQQVFWNLIQNATKFTPAGGRVTVSCRRVQDCALIEVCDTGIGIDAEQLERVFSAFEQASSGRTRRFGGLGLGLTISKALVELHGGTITAHSAGRNQGATLRVQLPLCVPAPTPHCEPPADTPTPPPAGARILLVEDHADTARMMARLLRGAGHDVATADSVAAALRAIEHGTFDLLISDLGLPDRSGLELMRELRAKGITFPAIAMTGYGQEEDLLHSRAAGFAAHLTKPINLESLELTLAKTLRR